MTKMEETNLCSCWQLSMTHVTLQGLSVNIPELYAICTADIHQSVLVFEKKPGLYESWDGKRHIWLVKDRCKEWCHMFLLQDIICCISLWCLPANGTKQKTYVYNNSCY